MRSPLSGRLPSLPHTPRRGSARASSRPASAPQPQPQPQPHVGGDPQGAAPEPEEDASAEEPSDPRPLTPQEATADDWARELRLAAIRAGEVSARRSGDDGGDADRYESAGPYGAEGSPTPSASGATRSALPEPLARAWRAARRYMTPSQGLVLFFSSLSLLFATLASYYYWQNRLNEARARSYQDQLRVLQEQAGFTDVAAHKAAVEELASGRGSPAPGQTPAATGHAGTTDTATAALPAPAPETLHTDEDEHIRKMERDMLARQKAAVSDTAPTPAPGESTDSAAPPAASPASAGSAGSSGSPESANSSAPEISATPSGPVAAIDPQELDRIRAALSPLVEEPQVVLSPADKAGLHVQAPALFAEGESRLTAQGRTLLGRVARETAPFLAAHRVRLVLKHSSADALARDRGTALLQCLTATEATIPAARLHIEVVPAPAGAGEDTLDIYLEPAPPETQPGTPRPQRSASPFPDDAA
ncbi:hypothetical protein DB346_18475 [Verrucomicrobia bacterium LW23]|nr:hypothetical protein DB346_18475 [Verrucomicrobia bacterium LW23]